MKTVILTHFGPPDGLHVQEMAKPEPSNHDVLIHIAATTVSAGDYELRSLHFPLIFKLPLLLYMRFFRSGPLILGQEFAGEIEAVGKAVTRFSKGDQVFGWTGLALGAYAEYICRPEDGVLALKPSRLSYEEAAPLAVGGLEAVSFLRHGDIRSGQKVLIYGAGGSIGTFAVQLAIALGAEVTAVDSAEKLEMLRSLGAGQALDYRQEDFTKSGETYDVIFDVIGKSPFAGSVRSLAPKGYYLLNNSGPSRKLRGQWVALSSRKKVIHWTPQTAGETSANIQLLTKLIEAGKMKTVIDKKYPLEQIVEAHGYVDTGQKKGNIVITVR